MSSDLNFYVEIFEEGSWTIPQEHRSIDAGGWPNAIASLRRGDRDWLFLDETSPFRLTPGAPPASPLCRFIEEQWWNAPQVSWQDQCKPHWLPVPELMIELWDLPGALTLTGRVEASMAALFGDGGAEFPKQALLAAGVGAATIEEVRQSGRPAGAPQSTAFANSRHARRSHPIDVTWSASIAGILGSDLCGAFRALGRLAPPERLRIVTVWA